MASRAFRSPIVSSRGAKTSSVTAASPRSTRACRRHPWRHRRRASGRQCRDHRRCARSSPAWRKRRVRGAWKAEDHALFPSSLRPHCTCGLRGGGKRSADEHQTLTFYEQAPQASVNAPTRSRRVIAACPSAAACAPVRATRFRPPRAFRLGQTTARGHLRADFEDVWPRYLPAPSPQETQHAYPAHSSRSWSMASRDHIATQRLTRTRRPSCSRTVIRTARLR